VSPNTREIDQRLGEAIRLYRSGRLVEAARVCESVRQHAPSNQTALLLAGTIELQTGRYEAADGLFQLAQGVAPLSADAATGRANALRAMGKHDHALSVLDAILSQRPDHAIAWNNRGNLLLETGRSEDAIRSYDRAISTNPDYFDGWHNRGVARMASGDSAGAEVDFTRALELKPHYVQALLNRGTARARQGSERGHDALSDLQKAVSLGDSNPDAWHILGQVYLALGRGDEALSTWSTGLTRQPDHAAMRNERGSLFNALGQYPDAASDFERLISLRPRDAAAWQGHGTALARLNHNDQAILSFSEALRCKPNDILSLYNRAAALSVLKRYREASCDLEALIALDPEFPLARGLLLNVRLHLCDWKDLDRQREDVDACLRRGVRAIHPFTYVLISGSPAMELACARLQTAGANPGARTPLYRDAQYVHEKIRIAYVSSDFCQHASSYLMAGVLEAHDRSQFDVLGISYGIDDRSPTRARIEQGCTRFFDVRERDDLSIATLMRDLEIDIAIDLKGHTGDARPGIFAHRPCPVQANYLGYPGSMGADYIDYLIADRTVIPPDHHQFYAEQIAYLPDTYQPNDSVRQIAPDRIARRDTNLPEGAFVFCCFNGSQKILPSTFDSWMRILSCSEGSVLWLLEDNPDATANLRREAQARGIAAERVIFARHERADRHLARLRLADLVLDTLPYGAHTTASDALWAGVPVLTCIGSSFAGRVAASLLQASGLPELITESALEYERMAQTLVASPARLSEIRERLARNRQSCALFDTVRITRNLEAVYLRMWELHQRGEAPTSFELP
jgi:protein O-GlcNAc transferase